MFLAVIGLIAIVISFVVTGLHTQTSDKVNLKPLAWSIRVIGVLLFLGGLVTSSVVIVPAGHRAVVMRFGGVVGSVAEGIHFMIPGVNTIEKMETRTQKEESKATAASKDLQTVTTNLALNFRVDPNRVANLYREVGLEYKSRIIDPAVQESVKMVTAGYTAEELIRLRSKVKSEIELDITRRLKAYNIIVEPSGLSITNFDFSPEFNKAVEEKQVALQRAERQKYVLQQAELEKQTQITLAHGRSEAAKLNAEALKVQGGELVVAREWIEKWDGRLPNVVGGGTGGNSLLLDISKFMGDAGKKR